MKGQVFTVAKLHYLRGILPYILFMLLASNLYAAPDNTNILNAEKFMSHMFRG